MTASANILEREREREREREKGKGREEDWKAEEGERC
jgi:hypothetical protein